MCPSSPCEVEDGESQGLQGEWPVLALSWPCPRGLGDMARAIRLTRGLSALTEAILGRVANTQAAHWKAVTWDFRRGIQPCRCFPKGQGHPWVEE